MIVSIRVAVVAAALAASPALAQQVVGPQSIAPSERRDAYIPYGPTCDRAGVRECQADARFKMSMCDPFPGRFACADRILGEQSVCLAATGCD
jgi:hypothetical protein